MSTARYGVRAPGDREGMVCPLCGGPLSSRPLHRHDGWRVLVCRACGHGVTTPRPTLEELESLYEPRSYFEQRGLSADSVEAGHRAFVESTRARLGGAAWLDVGAGTGGLLAAARAAGYRVAGTEYSAVAAESAKHNFDLDLRVGPFSAGQFTAEERFDVATMIHVLEHLPDPVDALRVVRGLLAKGGHMVIEVPHARAFAARFPGPWARLVYDLPYHLHHFTPGSLRRALESAGLEVVSVLASIPKPLDAVLGMASRLRRRRGASGTGVLPVPSGSASGVPAGPGPALRYRPSPPGRLVTFVRDTLPGYKITALARCDAP